MVKPMNHNEAAWIAEHQAEGDNGRACQELAECCLALLRLVDRHDDGCQYVLWSLRNIDVVPTKADFARECSCVLGRTVRLLDAMGIESPEWLWL